MFRATVEHAMRESRFDAACGGKTVRFVFLFRIDRDGAADVYFLSPNQFEIEAGPPEFNIEKSSDVPCSPLGPVGCSAQTVGQLTYRGGSVGLEFNSWQPRHGRPTSSPTEPLMRTHRLDTSPRCRPSPDDSSRCTSGDI
jgi:hypothetical protein